MNLGIEYRPQLLEDVYGHETVIGELEKRFKDNNFPRTMLLAGKTGVGKTTLARIIAKGILCNNKDANGNPCNKCDICLTVDTEKKSTYYFEYNASDLKIDDVRDLASISRQKPMGKAKSKVFVIDEMQEMTKTKAALNNMLKILEVPSKNSYFILGTMNLGSLPEAIVNRSVPYILHPIPQTEIANCLMGICLDKGVEMNAGKEDALLAIAFSCGNSLRTAVSYLERILYDNTNTLWEKDKLLSELGIINEDGFNEILVGLFQGEVNFNAKFLNDKIVKDLRFRVTLAYKHLLGVDLNKWEKSLINKTGFSQLTPEVVQQMIEEINKIERFLYVTPSLLEFYLLNCVLISKNYLSGVDEKLTKLLSTEQKEEPKQVRRRRKP